MTNNTKRATGPYLITMESVNGRVYLYQSSFGGWKWTSEASLATYLGTKRDAVFVARHSGIGAGWAIRPLAEIVTELRKAE